MVGGAVLAGGRGDGLQQLLWGQAKVWIWGMGEVGQEMGLRAVYEHEEAVGEVRWTDSDYRLIWMIG